MILVTGGTGHLGANLVRRLMDDGCTIRVLLRPESDNRALDGLEVERVYGDLRDPDACHAAVRGCKQIHHCAAKVSTLDGDYLHKREIFECNVLGTRNLLGAALRAGVERVVVTGSFSAVGHDSARPSDETVPFDPFAPSLPYGASKAAVEHECLKAYSDGLQVVVAVSCAILGPHDYKPSRMGRTLRDFANGKLHFYVPGGFEFVAASDMVEGHLLAMTKGRPGQKYIFSTQFLTVDELFTIFEEVSGRQRPWLRLPGPTMAALARVSDFVLTRFLPNMPRRFTPAAVRILRMHRRADISKAKTELGYRPGNIVDAIRAAYDFFVNRGEILPAKTRDPKLERIPKVDEART
jgi:nucleoside-diphosphate-sugar epimerase